MFYPKSPEYTRTKTCTLKLKRPCLRTFRLSAFPFLHCCWPFVVSESILPLPPLLPRMSHWCKTGQGALEDSSEESCLEVAYLVMEVAARMRWKKCPVPLSGNPAGVTDPSGGSWGPALSVATWCLQGRLCNLVPSAYRGRAVRSAENTNLRSRSVGLSPTTNNSPLPFQSMLLDHDLELP